MFDNVIAKPYVNLDFSVIRAKSQERESYIFLSVDIEGCLYWTTVQII